MGKILNEKKKQPYKFFIFIQKNKLLIKLSFKISGLCNASLSLQLGLER